MSPRNRREKVMTIAAAACMALFVCVALTGPAAAQSGALVNEAAGFDTLGFIQAATINTPGDLLSGGTIKVNDHVIIVPRNTILQMPAATLSWGQVFAQTPMASIGGVATDISMAGTRTGLALDDCLAPVGTGAGCLPGTWEAHVQGNIVKEDPTSPKCGAYADPVLGSCYIAGLIFLSQQSLNASSGFITDIDYARGILFVNGRTVMINDPPIPGLTNPTVTSTSVGRHTVGQSPDTRFTVDQSNPTIRSETGYPMCIPRVDPTGKNYLTEDPRCPQRNRHDPTTGALVYTFTMTPPRLNPLTTAPDPTTYDPWEQVPFEIGDFVTYAGILMPPCATGTGPGTNFACQPDLSAPQSSFIIAAYQVIANVGAYTAPGTDPAYVAIDVLLQGTGGIPNPDFPQEVTSKVKVEGMMTDPTRTVDAFALDQDCNGTLTDRLANPWAMFLAVDPGPPLGAKKGRFRWRPAGGAFLPPTSLVRVRVSNYLGYLGASTTDPLGNFLATPTISTNGLVYGQYNAPDFAFVFPENLGIGNPQLTYNFEDFPWLVNGSGPLPGNPSYSVGRINPWPDNPTTLNPPVTTCSPNQAPGLNASFTVTPDGISTPAIVGQPVILSAAASVESGATNLVWTLSPNPGLQCGNFACSFATFTPTTAKSMTITLTATQVVNGVVIGTATSSFTLNVTNSKPKDVVTILSAVYRLGKARLDVTASSSVGQGPIPPGCTLTNLLPGCMKTTLDIINPSTGLPYQALMGIVNGVYSVTFTGIPMPNLIIVESGYGGSAQSAVLKVTK